MAVGAAGLAVGMVYVDTVLHPYIHNSQSPLGALQPSAARNILAMLAGSMATIAGVVFSITVVALQLASSQFGPHVLRSFLADRGSQISLGTFVATFAYSILVITTVRDQAPFVPVVSTYVGILLGLSAIGVLIYFIDHIAKLIGPESVIRVLKRELDEAIQSLFPEQLGKGEAVVRETPPELPTGFEAAARTVAAQRSGYARRIDADGLMRLAATSNLLVRLNVRPGDFITAGTVLMAVAPACRLQGWLIGRLADCVVLGPRRTPRQDIGFAFQQLVEVAVRALSPGINAPFTAIPAIDWIGEGLCRIAERRLPALRRRDDAGRERVLVMRALNLGSLAREALDPIASAAHGHEVATARLLGVARLVAARARAEADRVELRAFIEAVQRESADLLPAERQRQRVREATRDGE